MAKKAKSHLRFSDREQQLGWVYFVIYLFFLPGLLRSLLPECGELTLNTIYYCINFLAIILIFRSFLGKSLEPIGQRPWRFLLIALIGFAAVLASDFAMELIVKRLAPGFANANDEAFRELTRSGKLLTLLCAAVLVPPVEECMFRGLIFRGLLPTNRVGAYCLSVLAFSGLHILSYLGTLSGQDLLICFVQYLPAGLVLAWSLEQTDSIYAPILIHAAVNTVGILTMR